MEWGAVLRIQRAVVNLMEFPAEKEAFLELWGWQPTTVTWKNSDCLKGETDFSRYFSIASKSVTSRGYLQLDWGRTHGLTFPLERSSDLASILPVLSVRTLNKAAHRHMEVFKSRLNDPLQWYTRFGCLQLPGAVRIPALKSHPDLM